MPTTTTPARRFVATLRLNRCLQDIRNGVIALPTPTVPVSARATDQAIQVNRKEAARRLGYSIATFDRLVTRGLLHPNCATGRPMFAIKELERFVAENSQAISV